MPGGLSGLDVVKEIKEKAKKMEIYSNITIYMLTGGGLTDEENEQVELYGIKELSKYFKFNYFSYKTYKHIKIEKHIWLRVQSLT
jgi:hypothetical protein